MANKKDLFEGRVVIIHDTETTGIDPEDRIIESAFIKIEADEVIYKEGLNKAPLPVKPAAAMTHGYRNSMLEGLPQFVETEQYANLKAFAESDAVYIAHNSPFDLGMMKKEGINWNNNVIDTLRVCKHLYADDERIEMHKLQYFRYLFEWDDKPWFKGFMDKLNVEEIKPHTALSDILILWIFVEQMMKDFKVTLDDMIELTKKPVLQKRITFGNIFEKKVATYEYIIDTTYYQFQKTKNGYEYLDWAVNNMENMDLDTEYSVKYHMAYGVLTKKIPMTKAYSMYLNWGIIFVFTDDEIRQALIMLGEDYSYRTALRDAMYTKHEKIEMAMLSTDEPEAKHIDAFKKSFFLLDYMKNYREHLLS